MDKVSIIVPIYNVDRYLKECLDSLINQTYENIEIILIDDGSTDSSSMICDKYAEKKNNIIVFHINNSGVSNARNYGIKKSTGKYIMFVDSDDIVDKDFVLKLITTIKEKKVDMVVCSYIFKYKNKAVFPSFPKNNFFNFEESIKELYKRDSIQGYSVNKIYKKEIIERNKIEFNNNIKVSEDMLFVFEYLLNCKKIYTIGDNLYSYRMRKSSASNKKDLSVFKVFNIMEQEYPNSYHYFIDNYIYCYYKYKKYLNAELKNKKIKLYKLIIGNEISLRTKLYSIYYSIIPSKLNDIIIKIKNKKNNYYD